MLVENKIINKNEITIVTSLDIAETFSKEHKRVLQDVRELKCSDEFRQHNFVLSDYLNKQNHKQPMYYITRDGFTLLVMGYTGEKAMQFKEAYIKQFNAMEKALREKYVEREKGIAVRQALTKAIQQSNENERMHGYAYSTYTNVIYKALFNKNANQLRKEYDIASNQNIRDYLSVEDLKAIQNMEMCVSSLMGFGWSYEAIKNFILEQGTLRIEMKEE